LEHLRTGPRLLGGGQAAERLVHRAVQVLYLITGLPDADQPVGERSLARN
jgi:hypothetical protein